MSDFYNSTPIQFFTRAQVDAAKGFLMLSIVIGHLRSLVGENADIFQFVYNYHVIGFLLLPFLYPLKDLNWSQVSNWVARFYGPFVFFFVVYTALNAFVLGADVSAWDVVKGLLIASPEMIDGATGSYVLWFLPHIFILMITLSLFFKTLRLPVMAMVAAAFVLHGLVGFIPRDLAFWAPFTGLNLLYLFFIGCALRGCVLYFGRPGILMGGVFFLIFIFLQYLSISSGRLLGYTGIWLPDFGSLGTLVLIDFLVLSAMLFLLYFKPLSKIKSLVWFGRNSLIIFLVHQPFLFVGWKAIEAVLGPAGGVFSMIIYSLFALSVAVGGSVFCVVAARKFPVLKRIVFPRNFADWGLGRSKVS